MSKEEAYKLVENIKQICEFQPECEDSYENDAYLAGFYKSISILVLRKIDTYTKRYNL